VGVNGSTVPLPLYGKASDIWGRKPILFVALGFFEIGSALCGASQNMHMLIASRVIQGIGGGGIMGLVNIIITDLTSLRYSPFFSFLVLVLERSLTCSDRAKWTSLIGATWAIAAASGPLVGGAIASRTTWRWCFLVNLPVGAVCCTIIFIYLHLDSPRLSFWDKAPRVDYLGTLLIGGSALVFLLALNWAGAGFGWGDARVIGLLVGSGAALIPFWLYVPRSCLGRQD
jgi:MFS family permease